MAELLAGRAARGSSARARHEELMPPSPRGMLLLCVLFTTHGDLVSMRTESLSCAGMRDSCGDEWVRARCASTCNGPDAGTRQVYSCMCLPACLMCVSCDWIGSKYAHACAPPLPPPPPPVSAAYSIRLKALGVTGHGKHHSLILEMASTRTQQYHADRSNVTVDVWARGAHACLASDFSPQ